MIFTYGDLKNISEDVLIFVEKWYTIFQPDGVHICDGSEEEKKYLIQILLDQKTIVPITKFENCYLARTNPLDVARVESKTYVCSKNQRLSVTKPKQGCTDQIGKWADEDEMRRHMLELYQGCMKGRKMYVIPYCMGQVGSNMSKIGIELTDSPYVVLSMTIMSIVGTHVLQSIKDKFVKCVHSVGLPLPLPADAKEIDYRWPCNPEKTLITHFPNTLEVLSFGSGYGGNSLLGKKSLALRIASYLAKTESWMAEHMLIMGLKSPEGRKIYISAAFPSACGKTNLAMLTPTLPGWKVTCVGDDIAWMKFDENGDLRAINPENGFFGVCPGTSNKSNHIAMEIIKKNTLFTNVCQTSDGGIYWEGLEEETDFKNLTFINWLNEPWTRDSKSRAAHPNSRFTAPLINCPILDENWHALNGVKVSAMIFGGRRPNGVPLVFQSFDWVHGVLLGSCVKSETTSAASDLKENTVVHDPFAMRPFVGYNCGDYMKHWIEMGKSHKHKIPLIFHVNWFLKDDDGKFLWPGFGENIRVLEWIMNRCQGKENYVETAIGLIPKEECFNLDGLDKVSFSKLFEIKKDFWINELKESRKFFENVINEEFPAELNEKLQEIEKRVESI